MRLGATPLLAVSLLPPLMAAYHERYPGVDLRLLDASADVLLNRLREGELDLALATFEHGRAFYALCTHMEPGYHQIEFDVRAWLTALDLAGPSAAPAAA